MRRLKLLGAIIGILSVSAMSLHAVAWYDGNYTRRKPITLNGTAAGDQADYQVKVFVTYNANMLANFGDIRFTAADGTTILNYWCETSTASASAGFWVKVPSLPAAGTTIYMYYGNNAANTVSNGPNTFIIYDDLESAAVNANIWDLSGSYSIGLKSDSPYEGLFCIGQDHDPGQGASSQYSLKLADGANVSYKVAMWTKGWTGSAWGGGNAYNLGGADLWGVPLDNTWHFSEAVISRTSPANLGYVGYDNGAQILIGTVAYAQGAQFLYGHRAWTNYAGDNSNYFRSDKVYVRKYIAPEPIVGAFGAEENSPCPTATVPLCEGVVSPMAISTLTPHFDAQYNTTTANSANAYQVQVNTRSDFNGTMMWDSGQQAMAAVANGARGPVPAAAYSGTTLAFTGGCYYWRIRFWDSAGQTGGWTQTRAVFSLTASPWFWQIQWNRRQPIRLEEPTGLAGTGSYMIEINIPYTPTMKSNFADIRFTDSDGSTFLPYWCKTSTTNVSAVFLIKYPALTPYTSKLIYMYYGNAAAGTLSDSTVVTYDDLESGVANPTIWNIAGSYSIGIKIDVVYQGTYSIGQDHDPGQGASSQYSLILPDDANAAYKISMYTRGWTGSAWGGGNAYNLGGVDIWGLPLDNTWHLDEFVISRVSTTYLGCVGKRDGAQAYYGMVNVVQGASFLLGHRAWTNGAGDNSNYFRSDNVMFYRYAPIQFGAGTEQQFALAQYISTTNWTSIVKAANRVTMGDNIAVISFTAVATGTATAHWKRFRIDETGGQPVSKLTVLVYEESGNDGFFDAGDRFIASGTFNSNRTCYLNMNRCPIGTTPKTYYIVEKVALDASGGQTIRLNVANSSYLEFEEGPCVGVPP